MEIMYLGKTLLVESEGKRILVIGDLHLGYEEALNEAGVFVSRETFGEVLEYFDELFVKIGGKKINEVVLLGDVKHIFGGVLKQERGDVVTLINYLLEKSEELTIIKGNHDSILEPILKGKERVNLLESYSVGNLCFIHGDKDEKSIWEKGVGMVVMGHVHPAIRLDDGIKNEKYKCFLIGKISRGLKKREIIVVPSFSNYNEGLDLSQSEIELPWKANLDNFEVRIVPEKGFDTLDFGKLGDIKEQF